MNEHTNHSEKEVPWIIHLVSEGGERLLLWNQDLSDDNGEAMNKAASQEGAGMLIDGRKPKGECGFVCLSYWCAKDSDIQQVEEDFKKRGALLYEGDSLTEHLQEVSIGKGLKDLPASVGTLRSMSFSSHVEAISQEAGNILFRHKTTGEKWAKGKAEGPKLKI